MREGRGEPATFKAPEKEAEGGDRGGLERTAMQLGLSRESPSPHTTFCSYCCFIDRKCWSHCLFTSSNCGERLGLAGDRQRRHKEGQLHMDWLSQCVRCVWENGGHGCSALNPPLLEDSTFPKAEPLSSAIFYLHQGSKTNTKGAVKLRNSVNFM